MRFLLIIYTAVFLFLTDNIFAQSPIYKHFSVNEGLPSSTVYDLIQDAKGYLWVATENGVARYDGKTFETFTSKDGLPENVILRLFSDSKGRIWFFSLNGKPSYYHNGKIHNATNNKTLAKFPDCGSVLNCIENDGNVYFASERGCFFALKGEQIFLRKNIKHTNVTKHFSSSLFMDNVGGVSIVNFYGFLYTVNKTYYFYTNSEIYKFKNSNSELIITQKKLGLQGLAHKQQLIANDLWICIADNGATKISGLENEQKITHYLPGKKVTGICKDHEGNTWFGTEGSGLWFMPANSEKVKYYTPNNNLPAVGITVLHKDARNNIWMGSGNGELYSLKNGKPVKYDVIPKANMINEFYDIWSDSGGYFYFTTNKYLVKWKENTTNTVLKYDDRLSVNYKAISGNKSGKVAIATRTAICLHDNYDKAYRPNKIKFHLLKNSKRIFTVHIDNNNKIWIANNYGFGYLHGDSFVSLAHIDPVLASPISKIIELYNGYLILATRTSGLILYKDEKVLQVINTKNGMPSDICNRINNNGNIIWVATHAGIAKLKFENSRITWLRNYTTNDGLLSNEVKDVVSTGDSIYVAFTEGLSVLKDETNKFSSPPPLYIKSVIYNNNDISKSADSSVYYTQSFTRFTFTAITFQHPEKVIYKYRLLGADNMWQTNTNGSVDYATLKPGKYTFQVRAKTLSSNWSEVKSYSFEITAPFWLQSWFSFALYALGFTIAGFGINTLARQQRKRKEKKLLMQNRMVQLEQQALAALMNPHFIFNALNSIQQYLHNNDTLSANKYLSLFAKLTRRNMEAVMKSEVTLDDELERLELYLQFEKLRFGEKLAYHIIVAENLDTEEISIPPMVIQPFVENAIWHGIMPLPNGGEITIEAISRNENAYIIEIKDNGIGIDVSRSMNAEAMHNSKGMTITQERLDMWTRSFGKSFSLNISQIADKNGISSGTSVKLTLPVIS